MLQNLFDELHRRFIEVEKLNTHARGATCGAGWVDSHDASHSLDEPAAVGQRELKVDDAAFGSGFVRADKDAPQRQVEGVISEKVFETFRTVLNEN